MKKICKRAGVKPFGFHGIRHMFASKLWREGMSLGEIQQMLRHKSPRVTEKYLQSLGLERVRKSLELIFNPPGEEEDPE
jgi:integrase